MPIRPDRFTQLPISINTPPKTWGIWAPYAGSEIGSGAGDLDLCEVGPEYKAVCHLLCMTNPGMVPVVFKVLGIESREFRGPW